MYSALDDIGFGPILDIAAIRPLGRGERPSLSFVRHQPRPSVGGRI